MATAEPLAPSPCHVLAAVLLKARARKYRSLLGEDDDAAGRRWLAEVARGGDVTDDGPA